MHRTAFCLFVAAGFLLEGCHCSRSTRPAAATDNTIAFHLGPVDPPRPRYIGHIIATNLVNPEQTFKVLVAGSVGSPGWITVSKGTTVLGAIKQAGGFAGGAGGSVRIFRGEKQYLYRLARKSLGPQLPGHYEICFGIEKTRSDAVLESDDKIVVPDVL